MAKSVSASGTATLSKPADQPDSKPGSTGRRPALRAVHPAAGAPGSPHPAFERTLSGWLDYVGRGHAEARDVLGSDAFDVEIWNE